MKEEKKKILIADTDQEIIKLLSAALKRKGVEVITAGNGPSALEAAVKHVPDVIFMEIDLPFLNAVKVAQILKSNPNLREVPVIFLSSGKINPDYLPYFQNAVIRKPFNVDEVITRTDALLLKAEKAKEVREEAKEVEGNLAQMSLVDILQIFSMNRKDGVIVVRKEEEGQEAMIFLKEGRIIDATAGTAKGEKALFRILGWDSGKFEYFPRDFHPEVTIDKSTDSLLMEGMRQLDEWKKMAGYFPPLDAHLYLKVDRGRFSQGLRPITQEVLSILEFYRKVEDIIDNCSYPDFDVMMTIHALVSKGIVEVRKKAKKEESGAAPLLTPEEAFAIKERLSSPLKEGYEMETVKIPLFARSIKEVREVANLLARINGFMVNSEFFSGADEDLVLGQMGRVKASENITLLLTALPMDGVYSPLWKPLMGNSIGFAVLRSDGRRDGRVKETVKRVREATGLKPAVMNVKEGLRRIDLEGDAICQMDLWEVSGEDAGKALRRLLDSFLNL